jgi:hypothetical protein
MDIKVNRDGVAAVLVAGFGGCTAIYAYQHYALGVFNRMGPGMFPLILGLVLVVIGVLLFAKSLLVEGEVVHIDVREALIILASLVVFGLLIRPFGMIPAVAALVVVSMAAAPPYSLGRIAALAAFVTALVVVIFDVAMNLHIPLIRWPF